MKLRTIVILAMACMFSSCRHRESPRSLVGTWQGDSVQTELGLVTPSVTFNRDGSFAYSHALQRDGKILPLAAKGYYTLSDSTLCMMQNDTLSKTNMTTVQISFPSAGVLMFHDPETNTIYRKLE